MPSKFPISLLFKAGATLALLFIIAAPPFLSAESAWLKGYAKTISGETIGYHSPYPDATAALLVRATDGTMAIEWESEPVPKDFADPFATFIWMTGLATQKGGHRFFLSANGHPLLAFRTGKDAAEKSWEIAGQDGASLSFKTTLVDQFQELFGFMSLKLPKSQLEPGKPVRFKVVGENGGSRDWFMVFQYDLKPGIRARSEQALIRGGGKLFQPVRIEISHIAPPQEAVISAEGGEKMRTRLETGYNAVDLAVEAVASEKDFTLGVEIGGRPAIKETVKLRPVVKRELYLLPHSHVDIGYSDLQTVVEKNHWKYFEEAIELARRTKNYPPAARFKWNVEVLWAVETYLRQATPEKREAFTDAVKKGWIGLQALLANELTGLCHPEELFHLTEFARRLSRQYGLPVKSAMITDIPSYTWSVVPALAQSGVKYFSSGPNYMPNLPDGGDRIGGALKNWGDRPFTWISPSGKEKVLFWMAGRGYSWFHGLNMGNLSFEKKQPIFDYLRELAEAGYPYEMVQVRYTTGGDNGPPDPNLSDFVKKWNEEYESPKFVIATSEEMFEEFERRSAQKIPALRGDFSPYWEDGAASTAAETAMNRASANRLLQAETLWAMIDPLNFPSEKFYEAWRQVVLYDEHTWGAADSVSNPDGENAKTQWAYKQAFAREGDKRSRDLLQTALPKLKKVETNRAAVDILNTNSWEMTDIIILSKELSSAGDLVQDGQGRAVPSQRLSTGELAFQAAAVPPFGANRYFILAGQPLKRGQARAEKNKLENDRLAISVDRRSGAILSFKWKSSREIEFVNAAETRGLNDYLYVPGRDPKNARGVQNVTISLKEQGPLIASLLIEAQAPGSNSLKRELRISSGLDRLDIFNLLDKKSVRNDESVHFAFPFSVAGGVVRLDLGWGIISPETDQIPGSCKDFFCVQNAVDIANQDYGITWVSLDAPLVEIGRMTDETRQEKSGRVWLAKAVPSQTIYSYVMNNYWHTNYKADQEGAVLFRYSVRPYSINDPSAVAKFGMERSRPLIAVPAEEKSPVLKPLLRIRPETIVATALRPSADRKGWFVRLSNPTSEPADVLLESGLAVQVAFFRSNPFEDRLEKISGPLRLAPFESAALRVERPRPDGPGLAPRKPSG